MRRPYRRTSFIWAVMLALASFLVVSGWIRSRLDWPTDSAVRHQIREYEAMQSEIDAIYLGTSRIATGLDPRVLDQVVSEQTGQPFQSYNLGIGGSFSFETDRLLRWILENRDPRLRVVIIEAPDFSARPLSFAGDASYRVVAWHDLRQGPSAARIRYSSPEAPESRLEETLTHLHSTLLWLGNYGMATDGDLFGWGDTKPNMPTIRQMNRGVRGFITGAKQLRRLRENEIHYNRSLSEREKSDRHPPLGPLEGEALVDQHGLLKASGLEFFYITTPTIHPSPNYDEGIASGRFPEIHRYDDPVKDFDLYEHRLRRDRDHLTEEGAALFSRRVGELVGRRLRADEPGSS